MDWTTPTFWIALLEIVWVNILLSGDNAVVIALAARHLKPDHQRTAVIGGSLAAIVMRILLTLFAITLLQLPWLRLLGGVLLLYVGVQLFLGEDEPSTDAGKADASVWKAVRTILIADLVMSLDNVLAVAGAAANAPAPLRTPLLVIGLGLSIPLIVFGSTLLMRLMERLPALVDLGAALLGWVAGEMAMNDGGLLGWLQSQRLAQPPVELAAALGAAFVVLVGRWRAARQSQSAS
jgi:YjbE family integral membrane protein